MFRQALNQVANNASRYSFRNSVGFAGLPEVLIVC
jgi:hypothetical protein